MKKFLQFDARTSRVTTPLYFDDGNRACVAAIQQIAGGDPSLALPLLIVGDSDTGKTRHLLELENLMIQRGRRVIGGNATAWVARFRASMRERALEQLAREIDEADLIVIDEFHRMMKSPATLGFLLQRIQERMARRLPVALATRHMPRDIRNITDRTASLMLGGFVVTVSRPGALVRRRFVARIAGTRLNADEQRRICDVTPGGLAALEVAVQQWVDRGTQGPPPPIVLDRILCVVAAETGVDASLIISRRRTLGVVRARQIFIVVSRRLGFGFESIARALDGRGRLALRRIEEQAAASKEASLHAIAERIAARLRHETRAGGAAQELS